MAIRYPAGLSDESRKWFKKIATEYQIDDSGGLLLLGTLCETIDRLRKAQAIIEAEGETIIDRFGQVKAHPLLAIENNARIGLLACIRQLNLDLEPLKAIGRPGGS